MAGPNYICTLGFKVFSDELDLIPMENETAKVINTISPNSYGITTRDKVFENALQHADYLVLDGVYFAFASLMLQGKNIKRNQGPDVFYHFMKRLNDKGGRAFFLGSSTATLEKIAKRVETEYPAITCGFYSPPFADEFSDAENELMVKQVNEFKPDILFVGMTCPKQEKWSIKHREALNAGLIISIGNVFDWFAGTQKPIHAIWFKLRLAWLIRIFVRPEIFRRNIGNQMKLFSDVVLMFLHLKKQPAH